jgi:hypothetical protein
MELKTVDNLTLAEWPEYYRQAIRKLEANRTAFISHKQIQEFKSYQKDIDAMYESANFLLTHTNHVLKMSKIINT